MPMVSVFDRQSGWIGISHASSPASAAYPEADRAYYYPIALRSSGVVRRVWWANGATTTGGATIEVGVYADSGYGPGTKVISGSATQGTASQVQFVDVTDTPVSSGLHWLAIRSSSATNTTVFRSNLGASYDSSFMFIQASASPLPATATPIEATASEVWLFGFATTASP
jgi:hypothetical protein